jgi:hypothetical protein
VIAPSALSGLLALFIYLEEYKTYDATVPTHTTLSNRLKIPLKKILAGE